MNYDPHATADLSDEAELMSKGHLVKARLADQPAPNVSWYWVKTGNCHACRHFTGTACTNPAITDEDFRWKYVFTNTCPGFGAGVPGDVLDDHNLADVLKAAHVLPGEPGQQVEILYNEPWSIDAAQRAHREMSVFLDMARMADYVAQGGKNDPSWLEYVDLNDDLEGAGQTSQVSAAPLEQLPKSDEDDIYNTYRRLLEGK